MISKVLLFISLAFLVACQATFSQHNNGPSSFLDSLLSKDHYNVELLDFENKDGSKNPDKKKEVTVVVRTTGLVKVSRNAQVITFSTSEDKLKFFESLKVDLQNETVLFKNDTIPFLDDINAPASSPFGEWHGYIWQKTRSNNTNESDIIVIDNQTYQSIEVDFGKVRNNNKFLLRIKYRDVDQGKSKAQFDAACYLN